MLGSLQAAGSSALNQALLGIPGAATEATETPDERVRREAAEDYHRAARFLGGGAGVAASMLAGGEFFKGVELAGQGVARAILPAEDVAHAALATRTAATAANFATQGAILSAPQALIQAAAGDPKRAAETMAWALGAGSVLGGAGELLGAAAKGTAEAAGGLLDSAAVRKVAKDFSDKQTLKLFGARQSDLNHLSESQMSSLVDFAHDNGLVVAGKTRLELGDLVDAAHKKWGQEIGDQIRGFDEALKGDATFEATQAAIKPGELGDKIKSALDSPELRYEMNADQARALDTVVRDANKIPTTWVNGREVVSFEKAQDFVSALRQKWVTGIKRAQSEGGVRGIETVTPLDRMKADAYQVARDALHEATDRVAVASGQPELVGQLAAAKTNYAKLAQLEKFSSVLERVKAGNNFVKLTDYLHAGQGPFSAATQAAATAMGALAGPGGALVGNAVGRMVGVPLDFLAKRWMEDRGMVVLTSLARRIAKEGPEAFTALLASEGAERLKATMSGVQDTIRKLAIRGIEDTGPSSKSEHMTELLGDTTGLTHEQQYTKLATHLTTLASNPQALAEAVAPVVGPIMQASPAVGGALQDQLHGTIAYLYSQLPKPPGPPAPFAPQDWAPTPQQKLDFHDKAEIVANPMRAMVHVARGTLSDAHMHALEDRYPAILGMMRQEVLTFAGKHPDVKLPAPERASVGKLVGTPLDNLSSPTGLQVLQQIYASAPPPGQQGGAPGGPRPNRKANLHKLPSAASGFAATMGPNEPPQ